jgi:NAD(P)-dependent dehydrogenase (short-subunit alcohol dehydrogenase family)
MARGTWLVTGVSSGFGRALTEQLLGGGAHMLGTVRRSEDHPTFFARVQHTEQRPVERTGTIA